LSPTFRALHNPNYRRYAIGSLISNTGTWMQRVAQDWLVLRLTDGEVSVAEQAPEHRHRTHAQWVVGMALVAQPPTQPHHTEPKLARQSGIAAGSHLDGSHIVSITHYLC
jgi:hypothetical protein